MCTPPRGLRGWGCPRRAAGPSVPLSADTVSPPPASVAGGGGPCLWGGEKGGFELAPRPRASVVGVSPFESFLAPQAAFGWCWPLGCRGCWGWSRAAWRGGGARGGGVGLCGVVSSVRRRSPSCPWRAVLPGARPAPPPPLPLRCLPSPPRVRGPCPLPAPPPVALALSGRAARARGRVRGCVRAPGTRAPAATRGTPRRLPAAARSPPGLWPCRGSSPRCARARPVAAVGAGGDKGGGCAVRPSPVWASASPRAPTPPPALPPVHLSGAPAPSVP